MDSPKVLSQSESKRILARRLSEELSKDTVAVRYNGEMANLMCANPTGPFD
jgi:hypothetical protein